MLYPDTTSPPTPVLGNLALIVASLGVCILTVVTVFVNGGILALMGVRGGEGWFDPPWLLTLMAYTGVTVLACAIPIVSLATRTSSFAGWLTVQIIAGITLALFGGMMFFLSMFSGLDQPPFAPRPWRDDAILTMPLVSVAAPVAMGVVMNRSSRWFDDDEPWLGRSITLGSVLVFVAVALAVALRVFVFLDRSR